MVKVCHIDIPYQSNGEYVKTVLSLSDDEYNVLKLYDGMNFWDSERDSSVIRDAVDREDFNDVNYFLEVYHKSAFGEDEFDNVIVTFGMFISGGEELLGIY